MDKETNSGKYRNKGVHRLPDLPIAQFPMADQVVRERTINYRQESKVDIILVNPPAPDRGIWIRSQHRVGRRSRENMIWPQVSLAQMAALLIPDYRIEIVDAIGLRMGWDEFENILRDRQPLYYLTQVIAPTLTNDMYGVFLAKSIKAKTIAFGTHVTPLAKETMDQFPALDFVLRGEPELTLRELIDTLELDNKRWDKNSEGYLVNPENGNELIGHKVMWKLWSDSDPNWQPAWTCADEDEEHLSTIKGLVWRRLGKIVVNRDRPFIKNLDDLPMPVHKLLPIDSYRMPMIKGPYTFIVTSRGCPAGCKFCIKHVSYQNSVRLRSARLLQEEISLLYDLGVKHIHMYADLFTVNRDQVVELCERLMRDGPKITWTANSRVDFVDEEMLKLMGKAGCMMISWGIESGNADVLKRAHKGYHMEQAYTALRWAKQAGIMNWGYFIIGLPGETVETIRQTISLSKKLPLDVCLFHVAAPYPGTPFFFEGMEKGWFRSGTKWEEIDMDEATVLDYPELKAEDILYWQKRAFREWAFRPGPIWTIIKSMNSWAGFKSAFDIGLQTLGWLKD